MGNDDKHDRLNTEPTNSPTDINDLLSELSAAQQAGVFQSSPQCNIAEASSLLSEANPEESVPAIFRMRRWVPFAAAAVLALTAITWGTMFSWKLSELREAKDRNQSGQLIVASTNGDVGFFDCLTGPKSDLGDQCKPFDVDNDGDVDMSDWAVNQQHSSAAHNR